MEGIKLKAVLAGRKAALLGAAVAVGGLSLLASAPANAAVGTSPGTLTFSAMTGPLTSAPTWSQTTACPAAESGSARLLIVLADGVTEQSWSANQNGAASALTNRPLATGATIGALETTASYAAGQTAELVVNCYSGASGTGTMVPFNDAYITFNTDGTTYTVTATHVGPQTPTVTMSATPNPVQIGNTVNLTATVTDPTTNAQVTTGTVQFMNGTGAIGTPVAVNASGVFTTQTTFTTAGTDSLTAVYQTANATLYNNATSAAVSETVSATNPNAIGELITVTVAPSGSFSITSAANPTAALTQSGLTATGTMVPVTVTDTRTGLAPNAGVASLVNGYNGYPGWSVVGQATDFTAPNSHPAGDIPVANFNWTPTSTTTSNPSTGGGFTLGAASTTGLGTAQSLASAIAGQGDGTFNLGAGLSLVIPASAPAGAYSSSLTLTANPTANFS